MATPTIKQVFSNPIHFLAFGFGSGLIRPAPGTWGTVAGVILFIPISPLPMLWQCLCLLAMIVIGTWACHRSSALLGVHDHGGIVIDEWAGMWLTLIFVETAWQDYLAAFALFRLFDIVKPWPIRWVDKNVDGGIGIMIDDLMAGAFAAACMLIWYTLQ